MSDRSVTVRFLALPGNLSRTAVSAQGAITTADLLMAAGAVAAATLRTPNLRPQIATLVRVFVTEARELVLGAPIDNSKPIEIRAPDVEHLGHEEARKVVLGALLDFGAWLSTHDEALGCNVSGRSHEAGALVGLATKFAMARGWPMGTAEADVEGWRKACGL